MKWESPGNHGDGSPQADSRIESILLTGFLGSGKTTLLNNLLKDPDLGETAVIINEFGDVAIDHLLVESSIENAVVLQSGCICCTIRGDLVDTLLDLLAKRERGDIPHFSRVAIETTGLADPSAIINTFATDRLIAGKFQLRTVVATIDAVNGIGQLQSFDEARRQAALADLIVLTKTDIAEPGARTRLEGEVRPINPSADIIEVENGKLAAADLFAMISPVPTEGSNTSRWLKAEAFEPSPASGASTPSAHRTAITSFSITVDDEIEPQALSRWLASITSLRGADLLRMKGLVAVRGRPGPVVLHAVQHIVHPPVELSSWPDGERKTRIVFITQNLSQTGLRNSFLALVNKAQMQPASANVQQ